MQPGETITPGGQPTAQPPTQPAPPVPESPKAPEPQPVAQPAVTPPTPVSAQPPTVLTQIERPPVSSSDVDYISWTASEYLIHHKTAGWYALLGLAIVGVGGVIWLVTQDMVSVVVVGIVGLIFGVAAARQPRVLEYRVDEAGLHMGSKSYPYTEFKSFSIIEEDSISSIMLLPLKRFMPGVSIYYPPEQEDAIANVLELYLPHEERKLDFVDRLMHKVRF